MFKHEQINCTHKDNEFSRDSAVKLNDEKTILTVYEILNKYQRVSRGFR